MPGKSSNLEQFWQELKRRNVTRVIAVYIAAAFMILELIDIISEPFGLPDWSLKTVFFILIAGLFITIIISWIYDIHPKEGIVKTKPADTIKPGDKPVTSYRWRIATYVSFVVIIGLVVLNVMGRSSKIRPGDIKSLLILPPKNYTGDAQLDIPISGMHAALIIDIGRISDLKIKSKTTSDVYKDADMTLSDIASELGVDALVEPAVFCMGDSICIGLTMFNGDEEQIWIAEYKEAKSQIFNLHNLITKQIAYEVKIQLSPDEDRLLAESRTADPDAIDAYFKGLFHYERVRKEDLEKATEYFEIAIEKEPDWAAPYAGLAGAWSALGFFGFIPQNIALPQRNIYFNKALELDPNSASSHYIKAMTATWWEWDWETGEREFLKSLELNPNNALCHLYYAHLLMILRRSDEAVYQAQLGLELDPLRPLVMGLYAVVMRNKGDYQSAITQCEKAISIDPQVQFAHRTLEESYRLNGDYAKSFEITKQYLPYAPIRLGDEVVSSIEKTFDEHGYFPAIEEYINALEEAAKEVYLSPCYLANYYSIVKNYNKALECLEKGYEVLDRRMPYINAGTKLDSLYDNPRFIAILEKMNLPLPDK